MILPSTYLALGVYQYTYPTFVDKPQLICVHFFTPDGQQAFVTYPGHPYPKAAQLVPIGWFESVTMVKLAGSSPLMHVLEVLFTNLRNNEKSTFLLESTSTTTFERYAPERLQVA